MKKLKLYLETSIWNFLFAEDSPEKKLITEEFFNDIVLKKYEIFISAIVIEEISNADDKKQKLLLGLIKKYQPSILEINEEVKDLSERYIINGAIPKSKPADALHAAISAVFEMDALISWNFKHLANLS